MSFSLFGNLFTFGFIRLYKWSLIAQDFYSTVDNIIRQYVPIIFDLQKAEIFSDLQQFHEELFKLELLSGENWLACVLEDWLAFLSKKMVGDLCSDGLPNCC